MKFKIISLVSLTVVANAIASSGVGAPSLLRRETAKQLTACDTKNFTPNLPLTNAYLNNIKQRLALASPEVFRDDLAPEHICLGAQKAQTGGRAWANSRARTITVESNLILRAQNDAQIAFMLGHELAHITMRHAYLDATPVTGNDAPTLQRLTGERNDLVEILFAMDKDDEESVALGERIAALTDQINELTKANVGENVNANWEEAEGDQNGANFYLRAGFIANEISWRTQQVIINKANNEDVYSPPPAMSSAQRLATAYRICGVTNPSAGMNEPERGKLRYPGECWSLWNLQHAEPARNPEYAQLLNDAEANVNVETSPTLEQVKAELRAAVNPTNPKP